MWDSIKRITSLFLKKNLRSHFHSIIIPIRTLSETKAREKWGLRSARRHRCQRFKSISMRLANAASQQLGEAGATQESSHRNSNNTLMVQRSKRQQLNSFHRPSWRKTPTIPIAGYSPTHGGMKPTISRQITTYLGRPLPSAHTHTTTRLAPADWASSAQVWISKASPGWTGL